MKRLQSNKAMGMLFTIAGVLMIAVGWTLTALYLENRISLHGQDLVAVGLLLWLLGTGYLLRRPGR